MCVFLRVGSVYKRQRRLVGSSIVKPCVCRLLSAGLFFFFPQTHSEINVFWNGGGGIVPHPPAQGGMGHYHLDKTNYQQPQRERKRMIERRTYIAGKIEKRPAGSRFTRLSLSLSLSLYHIEGQHTKLFSLANSGAAKRERRAVNSRWVIKINSHESLSSQQGQMLERNRDNAQTDK